MSGTQIWAAALGAVGTVLVLLGGIFGAYGASSGYWRNQDEDRVEREKATPGGENLPEKAEARAKAYKRSAAVARRADRGALLGWSLVIAGSILLLASEICGWLAAMAQTAPPA